VSIIPAIDFVAYTPYLIDIEIARTVREISSEVDGIVLNFIPEYIGPFDNFIKN
jgi:hypothetical protein